MNSNLNVLLYVRINSGHFLTCKENKPSDTIPIRENLSIIHFFPRNKKTKYIALIRKFENQTTLQGTIRPHLFGSTHVIYVILHYRNQVGVMSWDSISTTNIFSRTGNYVASINISFISNKCNIHEVECQVETAEYSRWIY